MALRVWGASETLCRFPPPDLRTCNWQDTRVLDSTNAGFNEVKRDRVKDKDKDSADGFLTSTTHVWCSPTLMDTAVLFVPRSIE